MSYENCCQIWHQGLRSEPVHHAPSPEALMRSRYSAYVLKHAEYLLATWHGSTTPEAIDFAPIRWLGLEIRHQEVRGDAGVVEFVARYRDSNGRGAMLHEISRFVRDGVGDAARWRYIDGQFPH